jgi:hypothetical protein
VVKYLNNNSGAVQAIVTAVLVVLTAFYVYATFRLLSATRRSQRPYVFLDVVGHGANYLEFGLANYGERAAERVKLDVEKDITDREGVALSARPPFSSGVTYLPPGRSYRWSFFAAKEFFEAGPGVNILKATITYAHGKKKYEESLELRPRMWCMAGEMLLSR